MIKATIAVCILLTLGCSEMYATLRDTAKVIDFSNVDLISFMYFKNNLPSDNVKNRGQVNNILEHFQKKKAVLDYFDHLFFGLSPFTQESEIPFHPQFGHAWKPYYERKYGWRGERLVEALGKGYSLLQLRQYGVIPTDFGTNSYPTR